MLDGLKHKLMAPEVAAEAMRAYAEETNRLNRERRTNAEADRKALADIERKLKDIVAAIEDGGYTRMLSDRLRVLEAQQDEITECLARAPINIPDIHPNVADTYRRKVARVADALNHLEDRYEAAAALRGLIERIVLAPGASGASFTLPYTANWGRSSNGLHAPNRCAKRRKLAPPPSFPDCQSQCMRGLDPRIHAACPHSPPPLPSPASGGGREAGGGMDCRVKPGNDEKGERASPPPPWGSEQNGNGYPPP